MLKRVVVLVAGLPGTGKSSLTDLIRERLGRFVEVSIDPIKEEIWDRDGFDSLADKHATEEAALVEFFRRIEWSMQRQERIVADYPFSEKQRPTLERLCAAHGYHPVTVRMVADLDVLYERQRARDFDPSRHLGHIVERYRPGETCTDRSNAPGLLSRDEFIRRCTTRGYDTFVLGPLMELDTTDFATVDFNSVIEWVEVQYRHDCGKAGGFLLDEERAT